MLNRKMLQSYIYLIGTKKHQWRTSLLTHTAQKNQYPPGNHHASHF